MFSREASANINRSGSSRSSRKRSRACFHALDERAIFVIAKRAHMKGQGRPYIRWRLPIRLGTAPSTLGDSAELRGRKVAVQRRVRLSLSVQVRLSGVYT